MVKGTTWYWKGGFGTTFYMEDADEVVVQFEEGITSIQVSCTDGPHLITVNVTDYSNMYYQEKVDEVISQIITPYNGITAYQKFCNITEWVGRETFYCVEYSGVKSMMIFGCGDCWASTSTIVTMCKKVGIEAWSRRGNQDPGGGSGHKNAIAYIDGKYYIGEAGYVGGKGRGCSIYEEPFGFSVSGSTIYQYDGKEKSLTIPSKIGNTAITTLGKGVSSVVTVFVNDGLESLHFTSGIQTIGKGALYGTDELTTITVDSDSKYLEAENNVLYTKYKKVLIQAPTTVTSLTISSNTTDIGYCALRKLQLERLIIPGTVKYLGMAFLYEATVEKMSILEGVETIEETAFQSLTTPKLILPSSIKKLGVAPFYYSKIDEIVLPKGLVEIPVGCFQSSRVSNIYIPDTVQIIGEQAFYSCYNLESVVLPVGIKEIGKNAFSSYTKEIFYKGTERQWNDVLFNSSLPEGIVIHFEYQPDSSSYDPYEDPYITSSELNPLDSASINKAVFSVVAMVIVMALL